MGKAILILLGLLLATAGTVFIFDARVLTKKFFSFGDQNEGSMGMKIIGFLLAIVGALIIFFNLK